MAPSVVRQIAPQGKGKPAPYRITAAGRGPFDELAFWVEAQAGKRPRRYKVRKDATGYHCECADARYGAAKQRRPCKHVKAVREMAEEYEVVMAAKRGVDGSENPAPAASTSAPAEPPPQATRPDARAAAAREQKATQEEDAAGKKLREALREPFHPDEVKWKPQTAKGSRALAVAYVDARAVMDRLDDVLGVAGWEDSYEVLPDGAVRCRLTIRPGFRDDPVTKEDVGGQSEQPDKHDKCKAAFCLPLDAQALTPAGWTSYDRLRAGDLVLGYDLASALCRWTPVRSVNVFDQPQGLWSLTSKSFNAVCTPAHRWVVHRREGGVTLKRTDLLDTRDRIVVAAPAEPGTHQLTAREAAVVGWLATDGSVSTDTPDRRRGPLAMQFHAFIHQSKVVTRESVRLLLGEDAVEHVTPPGSRLFPGHDSPSVTLERAAFRLRTPFAQSLLSRAGLYDGRCVEWHKLSGLVTNLNARARQAMFDAMLAGDGQHSASGQVKFGKKRKPGVMEAFEILATLQGVALGTPHSSDEPGRVPLRTLRQNPHTWHKCIDVGPAVPEAAWCPTTDLGTWVTRWQGQITITGNSDALKRAGVKFGIGRYLYHLPQQWVDYDPVKRTLLRKPTLPEWAMPGAKSPPPPPPEPEPEPEPEPADPRQQAQASSEAPRQERHGDRRPANGPPGTYYQPRTQATPAKPPTVWESALDYERRLVERGFCAAGELETDLRGDEALAFTYGDVPEEWIEDARGEVQKTCLAFGASCKLRKRPVAAQEEGRPR
jgi:hypothetical protein